MLYQILSLVLNVIGGLLTGALLLRWYMQKLRVSFNNPLGQVVLALTSWLVLPLRKITKNIPGGDWASLLGAWLVQLLQFALLWLAAGSKTAIVAVLIVATIGVVNVALSTMVVVLVVHCITSWLATGSAVMQTVFYQLTAPLLRPLRKVIPLVGGVDLSPVILLVLLQIGAIVLASWQTQLLTAVSV